MVQALKGGIMRSTEEIIEELENIFLNHDEYILDLLALLKKSIKEGEK